ncbi:MAG TPA: tetratricopeptide repeat protein [Candidatus Eisenbacteria bacterium]|jgi:tetratricopeptide (TPR) repeat protein|nr:tetratricopeptide repeat protein [Candidatus Eisenbacteria bacterium]
MKKTLGITALALSLAFGAAPAWADEWSDLNNRVTELYQKGSFDEAVPVAEKSLALAEKTYGAEKPETALALNNLAMLYKKQKRYADAESLYKRALKISESLVGPDHPDVTVALNNLALLHAAQGDYKTAEDLSLRALNILTKAYGKDHPTVVQAYQRYDELKRQAAAH